MSGAAQDPPARGPRGDREEHDRGRARRPDRRGRHRADVPHRRDARDRPRAARLLVSAGSGRRHRGHRADPRPRGPRRRAALRAPRDRDAAGDLRGRLDDRPGALEARGAPDARRAARGARARRAGAPGTVRARAGPHGALDPRLVRGGAAVRARPGGDHRRLQVRPDSGGRQPGGRLPPRRAGGGGGPLPVRRLDQCRPARGRAVRVERRAGAPGPVRALSRSDHRHLVRVQRPPRPAGDRRGRRAGPPGGARGPLDAKELQHRLEPGDRPDARRAVDPGRARSSRFRTTRWW